MLSLSRALPFFLSFALLGCPGPVALPDASEEFDAGITTDFPQDAGVIDAGGASDAGGDAGTMRDAGSSDAGVDAGVADAGREDAGQDAGGLPPAPLVAADASIAIDDAGYAASDLLGRGAQLTTLAWTLDGGAVIAVSAQSLVVGEGSACVLSPINRYTCDYRWISPVGATLAVVPNAYGGPHPRGEVMMFFRDWRVDCADPFFANRFLGSAIPLLVDAQTGATRLTWPRAESAALRGVMDEGDLIADPNAQRSCDAGAGITFSPITAYTRVRPPYQRFLGASALELGAERLLLIDGGYEVSRIEADGGRSTVVGNGPAASAALELDTFTLRRGDQFSRGAIDGGPLRPIATISPPLQLGFEGGRFASVIEVPDYSTRRIIDTEGLVPDLRYPFQGSLLERAPVLFGVDAANQLVVARVDQGLAATLPFLVTSSIYTWEHFPYDDAALVIDRNKVAWIIETSGVKRVADTAVNLPFRAFKPPRTSSSTLRALRGPTGGPLELLAIDRQTQRVVRLSDRAFVNLRPSYLGGCDVPGLLPGGSFFFFAEASAQAGQLDLFLVRTELTDLPRRVGTTLASACRAPVVSADGSRFAVEETLGGPVTVSVGTW